MKYQVIVIEYGNPLPDGIGAYQHPDGGTCALQVMQIAEFNDPNEALGFSIEMEAERNIHQCIVEKQK